MELIVEYLILIEKSTSSAFFHVCHSVEEFNNFLQSSNSKITINDNILTYGENLRIAYTISVGEVETKEQRFLHITFVFNHGEAHIDEYTNLLLFSEGISAYP